ncbi:MAG TPA: PRC-barrel domain-containing protein [Thermomicrobiales bacterium]|nr:PRC-barrel domain-containing protein [Thermomicrobiales bacterium]
MTVASEADDIRGSRVVDRHGAFLGRLADFVLAEHHEGIAYLDIESGGFMGFHARHSLIPVGAISAIDGETVHIDPAHPRVTPYQPELAPKRIAWWNRTGSRKIEPLYLIQRSNGGWSQIGPRV